MFPLSLYLHYVLWSGHSLKIAVIHLYFFPYFEFSKSLIHFQEEIFTPSFLVASYLKGINFNKKVYLYGFKGIAQELTDAGIDFIGLGVSIQILKMLIERKTFIMFHKLFSSHFSGHCCLAFLRDNNVQKMTRKVKEFRKTTVVSNSRSGLLKSCMSFFIERSELKKCPLWGWDDFFFMIWEKSRLFFP